MSKEKFYFSKSLEKGLKILALFNKETPVLTQSEIAKRLGLNMTSTYRYINTLEELGYLEKDVKTKEIRPTILCQVFCNNIMRATDHLRLIKKLVDRVHRENNISIDVVAVVDDAIRRLYNRDAEETLTYSLPESSTNCLHNTALGKAYLSSLPDDRLIEKIATMTLSAKTEKSIVDKNRLLAEIKATKIRGYAICEEEYLPGLIAIGAPLRDPITGKGVGAVSFDFSVLQHNAAKIEARYGHLVAETARMLSELLPPGRNLK
jgi:DNA-binding IclR family transcriptional regulator